MDFHGNASSFRSVLRGGAVSEEDVSCVIPAGAESHGSFNASSVEMLSDMSDMIRPLSQDVFEGDIDGEGHTAAKTCGDGTCALHALFGVPVRGELYASGVREVLAKGLKEELPSMMASLPSLGSKSLLSEVLKTVWRELKDVADRLSQNQDPDIDGRLLWQCCPDDVKESLLGFSRSRQLERDQQSLSTQELISFCHELFVPGHANLVRDLCVHLNYLSSTTPEGVTLQTVDCSDLAMSCEGERGALELLHPCLECPSVSKFQCLFVPDPIFDKYRQAFFLNAATSPGSGGDDWLYGTMSVLAEVSDDAEDYEVSALLHRGIDIIRRRNQCCRSLEVPSSCTSHQAWAIWKTVVLLSDYYFSIDELQFLASLTNTRVRVFWDFQLSELM